MGILRKLVTLYNLRHTLPSCVGLPKPFTLTAPMLSNITKNAVRRTSTKNTAARYVAGASRSFVQPSGADRANVVDVPSNYQDDNHFTPRPGIQGINIRMQGANTDW